MDFAAMAKLCAPTVAPDTLRRIALIESSFNPFAIGVVGGRLARQPKSKTEALATVNMLAASGYDYSVGVVQVNQKNFARYGLTAEAALEPCTNLHVGSLIFEDCQKRVGGSPRALGDALSCYYSGNVWTGYRQGYVARVLGASNGPTLAIHAIPQARHRSKVRSSPQQQAMTTSDTLFVSGRSAPVPGVAVGGVAPSKKGPATALLF